jgi:hypothetical protein
MFEIARRRTILHKEIRALKTAMEDAHGCEARYIKSVVVRARTPGGFVWMGRVAIFTLHGHSLATHGYGWSVPIGKHIKRITALDLPPMTSAHEAVRRTIV